MKVAVIGAGAAGLATASELLREGHAAVVFERSNRVGGLWVYREETETDPLGQCPRRRIHSSLYASLRTNLPRDLMAFDNYPFDTSGGGDDGWHRYPGHPRVLEYLERFGADKALLPHVRFEREVGRVTPEEPGWSVDGERFEAVAVCNGHFSEPYVPPIPGLADFRGQVLHSHNYRRPDGFADRRVVVLGSSVSGADLARELHGVAREVYFSGRAFGSSHTGNDGVRRRPALVRLDGSDAVLANGERIGGIDALVLCTGYHYRFPFLDGVETRVRNNRVRNLYRQLVDIDRPSLAFIGLSFRIVPFPFFQRQARWFARLLGGRFALPPRSARRKALAAQLRQNRHRGIAERHFHRLGDDQIDYLDDLARECADAPLPTWFAELWREHRANALAHPGTYHDLTLKAHGPTVVTV